MAMSSRCSRGRSRRCWQLLLALCCLAGALQTSSALDFEMTAQTKCIFEELNANVIVVGDFKATNKDNPTVPVNVDVRVRMMQRHAAPVSARSGGWQLLPWGSS